ncbi:MAG: hypothetical protein JSW60_04320 [Thermoplasmatales archaeon]|nr:MAG: hypothetical protein JSW60_04320 [Thermoplasmatales archaeon]
MEKKRVKKLVVVKWKVIIRIITVTNISRTTKDAVKRVIDTFFHIHNVTKENQHERNW